MCFLNWTDQGAKTAKEAEKRHQATKMAADRDIAGCVKNDRPSADSSPMPRLG
jgi:uncharacterized protein with GYD domain